MRAAGAGRGTFATGSSVIVLDLEPAPLGYVDIKLRTPPRPIKVEDAEAAAAVRVTQCAQQPKVGESRELEDAGLGLFDTPLETSNREKIKLGALPGPAQLEALPGPAPKKRRAEPAKCAHGTASHAARKLT